MNIIIPNQLTLSILSPIVRIGLLLVLVLGRLPAPAAPPPGVTDTIVVSKNHVNKKFKVKLYPNATHEALFFTATGEEDKIYQLFLFDLESNLVKQTRVRNRQTSFISKLSRGEYLYEVFCNDERIENGQILVR